jgi:hypothetical protein
LQVGAIITPSFPQESEIDAPADSRRRDGLTSGTSDDVVVSILGNNLLEHTTALLFNAGVERPTVVRDLRFNRISRERSSNFSNSSSVWEQSITQFAQQGHELLLLIGSTAYTDLDYAELVRFHRERRAMVTQVYATDGALDIAVINSSRLRTPHSSLLNAITGPHERFSYRGYVNRLRGLVDCMQLVEDVLYRRCELKPAATEVANGVWIGDDAEVDDSCVIGSPCFIGEKTRIAACSNISAGSAIETACHIDSGTAIKESWILPETYVGVGLNVHRSIINKKKIFHLDRGTEVTVSDPRLIGSTRSFPLFRSGERLFSRMQVGT